MSKPKRSLSWCPHLATNSSVVSAAAISLILRHSSAMLYKSTGAAHKLARSFPVLAALFVAPTTTPAFVRSCTSNGDKASALFSCVLVSYRPCPPKITNGASWPIEPSAALHAPLVSTPSVGSHVSASLHSPPVLEAWPSPGPLSRFPLAALRHELIFFPSPLCSACPPRT